MNPHSFVRRTTALLLLSVSIPVLAEPAGSLDPTFDSDGKQTLGFDAIAQQGVESTDDVAYAMALAPGGRIYLAGAVSRGQDDKAIGLARLKHDGSLDTSFGNEGRVVHDAVDGVSVGFGSALQPDGKLVVAGWAKNEGGGAQAMACRFEQDGAPDTNFGAPETPGCRLFPEESMSNYHASAVAIQADGRIVLAGSKTGRAMLARLHTDGTIDTAFGNMGTYQPGAPHLSSGFRDVTQMPDGDLVAAGHTNLSQQNGDHDILLVRLDQANGEPDLAFAPNGIKVFSISQSIEVKRRSDSAGSVHALPDGSLLLTGETRTDYSYDAAFSSRPFAMRLLPNGQYDQGFGGGKRIYYPCPLQQWDCSIDWISSVVLADQRIVLAGSYRTSTAVGDGFPVEDFFAMRLLPNGLPDPTFGSQMGDMEGTVVFDFGPLEPTKSPGYAAAVRVDGERVVLAGFAVKPAEGTQQSNNLEFAIARLDHGLDQTFDVSSDSAGNGTLSPTLQQNVKHSDHVDFDVHPAPGYGLDTIEGCGGALYGKVYTTGPIVADCMVTATFELKPVPLFSDQFEQ